MKAIERRREALSSAFPLSSCCYVVFQLFRGGRVIHPESEQDRFGNANDLIGRNVWLSGSIRP